MTLPDIDHLTPDDLRALQAVAGQRLQALEQDAATERDTIRGTLPGVIGDLTTEIARVQAVMDTPNADIKANPQVHIISTARAVRRSLTAMQAALRLLDR